MFRVRRKQHNSDHQDQDHRRDGEREDTAVKPEVPGTQASSSPSPSARKASQGTTPRQLTPLQPPPRSSTLSALSEPWSPRKKGSLSGLRVISSGAQSATAEPPLASEIPHRREAPLVSRLHLAQYQDYGRPNKVETLVTIKSIKSTEFEEEKEEESSSASTCLSHHPGSKTSLPLLGSDELNSLSALERSTLLILARLKRESAGIGRITHTDRTSSPRSRNLLPGKSTTVALEEDRCAADTLRSPAEPWLRSAADRLDGLNVDDWTTFGDPEEDVQAPQADRSLKECCEEISRLLKRRGKDCSSGAQSATAEPPLASEIPHRREAPLVSGLHQYQDYGRPNKVETLVTNKSIKSTEFEEEKEEESSSASTGPKTTVPPDGSDEISRLLVQLSRLIIERLKRETAGIGRIPPTGRTSSPRSRSVLHGKSTTVAFKEDRCAADTLRSSVEPRLRRPDFLNVGYVKTSGEPDEHIHGRQAAQLLELLCKRMQRLLEEKAEDEEDEDFCRICRGTDSSPTNPLTSPCRCKGSLKFIHIDCLKNWTGARIEKGLGPYSVQCCELCMGLMRLDPAALNIQDFYRETQQQMLNNPERYPLMALLHRPSRLRRFVLRVRRWMTFGRSS